MGRLNFGQLKYLYYKLSKQLLKCIPYNYRKPFYLVSSVLGLLAYFKFMLYITNSRYLLAIKEGITSLYNILTSMADKGILTIIALLFLGLIFYRYCLPPSNDKEKYSRSLYKEVNTIITLSYIIITICGLLPFLL